MRTAIVLFIGIILGADSVSAQPVTLVKDGKSRCVIRVEVGATPAMRHGAEELRRFLKEISGADITITEGAQPRSAAHTAAVLVETDPRLGEEELRIRTQGKVVRISGGGKRGAMYGCYALLEDVLGCRWYNTRITRIPRRATIKIPPLDIHQKPAFEYREPYYAEALDRDWAVRNRTNGNFQALDESVGGRVAYGAFVHTFNSLVPQEQYFDQHPEYFSMVNGKRAKRTYTQLCLTNPDVLRLVIAKVKEWIAANPNATIFSVSQNDADASPTRCECPACKAVEQEEGAPSGVLLRFVNAVADAIAKEHPNVLIDTLAYQWSEAPPKHVRPHPNVRVRLAFGACFSHPLDKCHVNKHSLDDLTAWAGITNQLYVWSYATNFANYLQPLPDLDEIAGDISLFHKYGVVGLFYEGAYGRGGGGEMSELKSYLMAKLMWNPSLPAGPIITEYLNAVYGKGAPYIARWLDQLHAPGRAGKVHAYLTDPPTAPYLSPAILAQGTKLFDAAQKATSGNPASNDEVQRARMALEYVQVMQNPQARELAGRLAAKIRKYGVGQAREGEPIDNFLKRIGE